MFVYVPVGVVEYCHWYTTVAPDGVIAPAVSWKPTRVEPVIAPMDVIGVVDEGAADTCTVATLVTVPE